MASVTTRRAHLQQQANAAATPASATLQTQYEEVVRVAATFEGESTGRTQNSYFVELSGVFCRRIVLLFYAKRVKVRCFVGCQILCVAALDNYMS